MSRSTTILSALYVVAVWCVVMSFLLSLVPDATCVDGWRSSSIGVRGACSHHGGVESNGHLIMFALFGSTIASIAIFVISVNLVTKIGSFVANLDTNKSGAHQITPPYGSLEAFESAMRNQGFSEADIKRSLAIYRPESAPPVT